MTDIRQRIEDIVTKHGELEDSGGVCECGWWTKGEAHAAHVASVITSELGLIQEWGVQITENGKTVIETNPGRGEPLTREMAFYENRRWPSYGYDTEGVRTRFVSLWFHVEEERQ